MAVNAAVNDSTIDVRLIGWWLENGAQSPSLMIGNTLAAVHFAEAALDIITLLK